MTAGACKLIGKMVVKVNLVGSQGSGSHLAQVARTECLADSRAKFVGGKNLNGERNTEK